MKLEGHAERIATTEEVTRRTDERLDETNAVLERNVENVYDRIAQEILALKQDLEHKFTLQVRSAAQPPASGYALAARGGAAGAAPPRSRARPAPYSVAFLGFAANRTARE